MKRQLLAAVLAALLAACAHQSGPGPDVVRAKVVYALVAQPCAISAPRPAFADTAEAIAAVPAGGIEALSRLYAAGRQQRLAYIARLEAANTGCSAPN